MSRAIESFDRRDAAVTYRLREPQGTRVLRRGRVRLVGVLGQGRTSGHHESGRPASKDLASANANARANDVHNRLKGVSRVRRVECLSAEGRQAIDLSGALVSRPRFLL